MHFQPQNERNNLVSFTPICPNTHLISLNNSSTRSDPETTCFPSCPLKIPFSLISPSFTFTNGSLKIELDIPPKSSVEGGMSVDDDDDEEEEEVDGVEGERFV